MHYSVIQYSVIRSWRHLIYGMVLTDMFHKSRLDLRDKVKIRDSKLKEQFNVNFEENNKRVQCLVNSDLVWICAQDVDSSRKSNSIID